MSKLFNLVKNAVLVESPETKAVDSELPERVVRLKVPDSSPIFPFGGYSVASEQYRMIRTKILHHHRKPHTILVSSAVSGDGKTVTAINVAASLALKSEARVLLLEGDLRRPRVSEALGIPSEPGFAAVLSGNADAEAAMLRTQQFPNLFVLPAGRPGSHAAELLDSQNCRQFIRELRKRFTTVIVDGPPVNAVADWDVLQSTCEATILVVRPDHTNRAAFQRALDSIPKEKLLGVVMNCTENWWLWQTPAYEYYGK